MGVIINPRGPSGSGKTELARRILANYGWARTGSAQSIYREGRERPIGYRLSHPFGGRPLVVLGHYERTSGGCDTIPAAHGGLDEVFRMANAWAAAKHDVLFEGAALSTDCRRSAELAGRHRMYVLLLSTPTDQAARNLTARRRARRSGWSAVLPTVRTQRQAIDAACGSLRDIAEVEEWDFNGALNRARELLGLGPTATWQHLQPRVGC